MILLDHFFYIRQQAEVDKTLMVTVELNPDHSIFAGHFPGQPVVPGVCMLQMIKEINELNCGKKLQLIKADYLKFLAVIDPLKNPTVIVSFTAEWRDGNLFLLGKLHAAETIFLKFKASFSVNMPS